MVCFGINIFYVNFLNKFYICLIYKTMNKPDRFRDPDDTVYYNITLRNPEAYNIDAKINDTRVQTILDNPSQYELTVARFSIPAYNIPIMFYRDDMSILFEYDGAFIQEPLSFIPNEEVQLYGRDTIWSYLEMVEMLNNTMVDLYNQMKLAKPLVPNLAPPFFSFDNKTNLLSLYTDDTYASSNGVNTIKIVINERIQRLMPTFRYVSGSPLPPFLNYRFVIEKNNFNQVDIGGVNYLKTEQDSETTYLWSELQSVQFETNAIPVNPEFLSAQNNQIRRIITDFEPEKGSASRQTIQFFPQGPLRYYDLLSKYPLREIDLSIFWEDRDGGTYPIKISNGDVLTCKLKFRKKMFRHLKDVFDDETT